MRCRSRSAWPLCRQRAAAPARELLVQRRPGHRPARQVAFLGEGCKVGLGPGRVGAGEGRVLVVVQPGQRLTAEADAEPDPFHVGHVPHDAEQRQVRRRHRR